MDSLDTQPEDTAQPASEPNCRRELIVAGRIEDLPAGQSIAVELADGNKLAVYNVAGEFFATDNACPHHGAPLAGGYLCGHVIECFLHGWQFDVRDGQCLTVSESIPTYRVVVEDGVIKVELGQSITGC